MANPPLSLCFIRVGFCSGLLRIKERSIKHAESPILYPSTTLPHPPRFFKTCLPDTSNLWPEPRVWYLYWCKPFFRWDTMWNFLYNWSPKQSMQILYIRSKYSCSSAKLLQDDGMQGDAEPLSRCKEWSLELWWWDDILPSNWRSPISRFSLISYLDLWQRSSSLWRWSKENLS